MRQLLRRLAHLIRRRHADTELAEEMAIHRAMAEDELRRGGMDADDAASAARRTFGSVALASDEASDVWIWRWLQWLSRASAWLSAPTAETWSG